MTTLLRTLLCALSLGCVREVSVAHAEPVATAFRAVILLRSLGYERGIAAGKGEVVLVVISGADPTSQSDAKDMVGAFSALAARLKVAQRTVVIRTLQHRKGKDTVAALRALVPTSSTGYPCVRMARPLAQDVRLA